MMMPELPQARAELDGREAAHADWYEELAEPLRPRRGRVVARLTARGDVSTRGGWLSSLRRHGRGRRASGPALKAVMRARRVGDSALKAALSLASSAKTHTARRHEKGMICVWVGSVSLPS